jgi:hypothetical protein
MQLLVRRRYIASPNLVAALKTLACAELSVLDIAAAFCIRSARDGKLKFHFFLFKSTTYDPVCVGRYTACVALSRHHPIVSIQGQPSTNRMPDERIERPRWPKAMPPTS